MSKKEPDRAYWLTSHLAALASGLAAKVGYRPFPDETAQRTEVAEWITGLASRLNGALATDELSGNLTEVPKQVTRFEVIDHRSDIAASQQGRVFIGVGVQVALDYQDDGRTLKVFVEDRRKSPGGSKP